MFRQLYHNPVSRFLEYLVSRAITKAMFREGFVTRDELLKHGDSWLENKISQYMGKPYFIPVFGWTSQYRLLKFKTRELALTEVVKSKDVPDTLAILDDFESHVKSGADKFLVRQNARTQTLREARPDLAEEMDELLVNDDEVFLIMASMRELRIPERLWAKFKSVVEPEGT